MMVKMTVYKMRNHQLPLMATDLADRGDNPNGEGILTAQGFVGESREDLAIAQLLEETKAIQQAEMANAIKLQVPVELRGSEPLLFR